MTIELRWKLQRLFRRRQIVDGRIDETLLLEPVASAW
jgi:hypothetical protein